MYNYNLRIRTFGGDPYNTGISTDTSNNPYTLHTINSDVYRQNRNNDANVYRTTYGSHINLDKRAILKQIQNTVQVSNSEYLMNKSSLIVAKDRSRTVATNSNSWWNQSSDSYNKSISSVIVPSHGNSTKSSITRLRPGSMKPGGNGVDVKHNSYARYLARLKGRKVLKQDNLSNPTILNTTPKIKFNIVAGCSC